MVVVSPQIPARAMLWAMLLGQVLRESHTCDDLNLPVVARLKGNLPELFQAAQKRFSQETPKLSFRLGRDQVEVWDADRS